MLSVPLWSCMDQCLPASGTFYPWLSSPSRFFCSFCLLEMQKKAPRAINEKRTRLPTIMPRMKMLSRFLSYAHLPALHSNDQQLVFLKQGDPSQTWIPSDVAVPLQTLGRPLRERHIPIVELLGVLLLSFPNYWSQYFSSHSKLFLHSTPSHLLVVTVELFEQSAMAGAMKHAAPSKMIRSF